MAKYYPSSGGSYTSNDSSSNVDFLYRLVLESSTSGRTVTVKATLQMCRTSGSWTYTCTNCGYTITIGGSSTNVTGDIYVGSDWTNLGSTSSSVSVGASGSFSINYGVSTYTVTPYMGSISTSGTATFSSSDTGVQPYTHTVTYDTNGGSGSYSNQTKKYGSTITLSSTIPTKSYTTNYTISYNANGGTVSKTSDTASATTSYSFKNWLASFDNSTTYSAGSVYGHDQNGGTVTLTAQWGATTTEYPTVTYPTPTRTGYNFNGWSSKSDSQSGETSGKISENTTLYAIWVAKTTTVTFYQTEAKKTSGGTSDIYKIITLTYDSTSNNTASLPSLTGYIFQGWNLDSSTQLYDKTGKYVSGVYWSSTGTWQSTVSAISLYGTWIEEGNKITYNINGSTRTAYTNQNGVITLLSNSDVPNTSESNSYTITYSIGSEAESAGVSKPNSQTATETKTWTLSSWSTTKTGINGITYELGSSQTFSSDTTLYAQFTLLSSVSAKVTLPSVTYNSDNKLLGWYSAETNGTKYGSAGETYILTGNITAYAHWGEANILVQLNPNNNTDDSSIELLLNTIDSDTISLPANTFAWGKHHFIGWSINENADKATYFNGQTITVPSDTEELVLYAIWAADIIPTRIWVNDNGVWKKTTKFYLYEKEDSTE